MKSWVLTCLLLSAFFINSSFALSCKVIDPLISADYKGECVNGLANGFGKASDKTAVYVGEFLDGKKHGIGLYKWPNGESAEAEWKNDRCDGKGIYYWPDGSRYEGSFKNGKREGKGVYYWPNGSSYEGVWHDWIAADIGALEENIKNRDQDAAVIGEEARKIAVRVKSMVAFISANIISGAYDESKSKKTLGNASEAKNENETLPVYKIQKYLFVLGYDIGKIDGVCGDKTEKAIRKFRADFGLDDSALIDGVFIKLLNERMMRNL